MTDGRSGRGRGASTGPVLLPRVSVSGPSAAAPCQCCCPVSVLLARVSAAGPVSVLLVPCQSCWPRVSAAGAHAAPYQCRWLCVSAAGAVYVYAVARETAGVSEGSSGVRRAGNRILTCRVERPPRGTAREGGRGGEGRGIH